MTTTTPDTTAIPSGATGGPSGRLRFGAAFLVGLMVALLVGVGAIYAYDQQYVGRVLPGVRVGSVDLSGLEPAVAADRLRAEYASLSEGEIVLDGPDGPITVTYDAVGRRADVEAMVADAMAVGRAGNPIERAIADARTALRGVTLAPRVTFDPDVVADLIATPVDRLARRPVEARVTRTEQGGFVIVPGRDGRKADATPAITAALAALGSLDAPARLDLEVPVVAVAPAVSTVEALNAKVQADRMTAKIVLAIEDVEKPQSISEAQLREWTTFAPTADGGYAPSIDTTELPAVLKKLAKKVDQAPVNASFTTKGGRITGVTKSQNGYKMDQAATASLVEAVLADRAAGALAPAVQPALAVTEPALTTAGAEAARPKMKKIASWQTYFQISERNGFGANIWIPAMDLDGYVVAPGATFDFWDAVGPVTRARGYRDGGAILNGRTNPTGALAGGICTTSTTLFNAVLQAGYQIEDRRNHYYYIDRYPLGLDATVFKGDGGYVQTVSWVNDTKYPVLIRGVKIRKGSDGWVRFDIYSVPTGRTVNISDPVVKNVKRATDTVEYTSALPTGTRKRVEYPVDGKQVWRTWRVWDKDGKLLHERTFYSNYSRITGVTQIGR